MNISDLRDEMLRCSVHWDGLQTKSGQQVNVGQTVRAWLKMVDSLTSKLVNPRKDEINYMKAQIDTLSKQVKELKRKKHYPTRDEDIRKNY